MKRLLILVAVVVAVLVLAAAALIVPAFMGRQSISDGAEANGLRVVKDGFVSVVVVPIGDRQVALIDAGNDGSAKAILAELSRRQMGADAVTAIFITHGHPDHTAAAHMFPRADIYALEREVPLVEGREGAHGPVTRLMPARPTGLSVSRPLHDGDSVRVGDTDVRAFAVPGHTAGSAAYLVKGVLVMGDAADVASDGRTIVGAPWVFSDSQAEDRASIVRLAQRLEQEHAAVQAIECAHSGLITAGIAPLTAFRAAN